MRLNKKLLNTLEIIGIAAALILVFYEIKDHIGSDEQFKKDMLFLDKEHELWQEKWDLYDMYQNNTLSTDAYKTKLQNLLEKLKSLERDGHENTWKYPEDGVGFFKSIDNSIDTVENRLKELGNN